MPSLFKKYWWLTDSLWIYFGLAAAEVLYAVYMFFAGRDRELSYWEFLLLFLVLDLVVLPFLTITYRIVFRLFKAAHTKAATLSGISFLVMLGGTCIWELAYWMMLKSTLTKGSFLSFYFDNEIGIMYWTWVGALCLLALFKNSSTNR